MTPEQINHLTNIYLHHHDRHVYHREKAKENHDMAVKEIGKNNGKYNFHSILEYHHLQQSKHHRKTKSMLNKVLEKHTLPK